MSIILLFVFGSCANNRSIDNLESDKIVGRAFVKSYYEDLTKNRITNILQKSSDTLLKNENKIRFLNLLDSVKRTIGDLKAYKPTSEETLRSEINGASLIYYRFQNKVEYEKGTISEIVFFTKENKEPIKLNSVRVLR